MKQPVEALYRLHLTTKPRRRRNRFITKRWVPKSLLQAQGYYTGTDQIWIPKRQQSIIKPAQKKPVFTTPQQKVSQVWRPKQDTITQERHSVQSTSTTSAPTTSAISIPKLIVSLYQRKTKLQVQYNRLWNLHNLRICHMYHTLSLQEWP